MGHTFNTESLERRRQSLEAASAAAQSSTLRGLIVDAQAATDVAESTYREFVPAVQGFIRRDIARVTAEREGRPRQVRNAEALESRGQVAGVVDLFHRAHNVSDDLTFHTAQALKDVVERLGRTWFEEVLPPENTSSEEAFATLIRFIVSVTPVGWFADGIAAIDDIRRRRSKRIAAADSEIRDLETYSSMSFGIAVLHRYFAELFNHLEGGRRPVPEEIGDAVSTLVADRRVEILESEQA